MASADPAHPAAMGEFPVGGLIGRTFFSSILRQPVPGRTGTWRVQSDDTVKPYFDENVSGTLLFSKKYFYSQRYYVA